VYSQQSIDTVYSQQSIDTPPRTPAEYADLPAPSQKRDAYRDKVSMTAFKSMRDFTARVGKPLSFLKVIHVGHGRDDVEMIVQQMGLPMVRGSPFTEGLYCAFDTTVPFEAMRELMIGVKNAVRRLPGRANDGTAAARFRFRFRPFIVSANSESLPILEEIGTAYMTASSHALPASPYAERFSDWDVHQAARAPWRARDVSCKSY
jgi:hypothetical protein